MIPVIGVILKVMPLAPASPVESRLLIADMRDRTYYVYIMSSPSRTLYTGVTNNLERRVSEHKENKPGSFTARYRATRLAYFEEFGDINDAIAREKQIKIMLRVRKIELIESMNPEWKDLSEQW